MYTVPVDINNTSTHINAHVCKTSESLDPHTKRDKSAFRIPLYVHPTHSSFIVQDPRPSLTLFLDAAVPVFGPVSS